MDAYNYDMANFTMTTQYSMMYDPTILMAYGNFEVDWNTLMYTKFLGLNESAFGKENINWEDETRNKNAITSSTCPLLTSEKRMAISFSVFS